MCAKRHSGDFIVNFKNIQHFNLAFPLLWDWDQISGLVLSRFKQITFPAKIFLFKVNSRNTRKMCEICSKLTIKTPE